MKYFILVLTPLLFSLGIVTADEIVLRDGTTTIEGTILSGDLDGFRIETKDASLGSKVIPLSRIKSFLTTEAKPSLEILLSVGDEIWRARMRLLRGDVFLANPTFARFFKQYDNSTSEDARLISEGALRCAIARGDLAEAFDPWMRTAKHRAEGFDSSYPNLTKVLDATTLLCPQMPPVFMLEADTRALTLPETPSGKTGKDFLETLLHASIADPDAVGILVSEMNSYPQWKQAWAQYFLALGYLQQKDDPKARNMGLLALARVASLPKSAQPWLAGASLYILSEEFAIDGKVAISEKMFRQLQRNFPTHPLLGEGTINIRNARE